MTDESTTHRTPFGIEVDRRQSHLAALPGKLHFEWFESLKRATQVFNGNYLDLERHLTQFVGTMVHVDDLPDGLGSAVVDGHDAAVEVQVLRDERGQRIDGPVADGSGDITVQLNDLPGHLLVERVTLEALQTFLDEVPWEQLSGVTDS